jgi:hypothetical protein
MIGKLTRQLHKTDVTTSLVYLGAAQALATTDDLRFTPSLKTTRVAVLYQLHSVRAKVCVELVSSLCCSLFSQLKSSNLGLSVPVNASLLDFLEQTEDNTLKYFEEILQHGISSAELSTGFTVRSNADFQLVLQRISKILTHSFLKLRDCRKLDSFEAFSVYRISDVILRLSSIKSTVKLTMSESPSKNESDAFDLLSDWLYSLAAAFQLSELSPREAQIELRKLFDKRRQQIVGIW